VVVVAAAVAGEEAVLDWVTVTVTVDAADLDLVFVVALAVRVDFVLVEVSVAEPGGCTVTVLDCELVRQTPGSLTLLQTPVSGGASALLPPAVVVSPPVSVALPVSLLLGESVHAGVPTMRQMERPMPVVVEVAEGTLTAASAAPDPPAGVEPPAARTLTGTAATTTRGAQRRARASTRADRSRRGTALPSQGGHGPPPRPDLGQRAYVRTTAPGSVGCRAPCGKVA
jgi:hypothetical protein